MSPSQSITILSLMQLLDVSRHWVVTIKSSRKTQIGHGSGAIMTELAGAPDNSTTYVGIKMQ
jgi:uncharacterized protein affecting Mg2+/Co2+ transport